MKMCTCGKLSKSILVGAILGSAIGGALGIAVNGKKKRSPVCKSAHKIFGILEDVMGNLSDITK